jgi:hypothetical protein
MNTCYNGKNILRCVYSYLLINFEFFFELRSTDSYSCLSTYTVHPFINLQKWETDCQSKKINANEMTKTSNGKLQINIEGLNPGATYTVRLRVMAEGSKSEAGKASPELIIDTEAVSCTPKPSCIIL